MNKGVNRLAILLGGIPSLSLLIFILVAVLFAQARPPFGELRGLVGLSAALFLIPFALVHAIAWVVRGFRQ